VSTRRRRSADQHDGAYALELVDVSKVYEVGGVELVALDHVDLAVAYNEVVTLLGPSGSGKTTLLSIAGGLLTASTGRVVVDGRDITHASARKLTAFRRREVGFIFQAVNLVPFLTARENLLVVAELAGRERGKAKRRADQLLEELGLAHRKGNLPSQLSGGERQRVAIGRALMNEPALVLVDEPTSALDSDLGQQVMELIVSEVKARGAAAVIVTHDVRMTSYGDRVLTMADGCIAEMAPRSEWITRRRAERDDHQPGDLPAAQAVGEPRPAGDLRPDRPGRAGRGGSPAGPVPVVQAPPGRRPPGGAPRRPGPPPEGEGWGGGYRPAPAPDWQETGEWEAEAAVAPGGWGTGSHPAWPGVGPEGLGGAGGPGPAGVWEDVYPGAAPGEHDRGPEWDEFGRLTPPRAPRVDPADVARAAMAGADFPTPPPPTRSPAPSGGRETARAGGRGSAGQAPAGATGRAPSGRPPGPSRPPEARPGPAGGASPPTFHAASPPRGNRPASPGAARPGPGEPRSSGRAGGPAGAPRARPPAGGPSRVRPPAGGPPGSPAPRRPAERGGRPGTPGADRPGGPQSARRPGGPPGRSWDDRGSGGVRRLPDARPGAGDDSVRPYMTGETARLPKRRPGQSRLPGRDTGAPAGGEGAAARPSDTGNHGAVGPRAGGRAGPGAGSREARAGRTRPGPAGDAAGLAGPPAADPTSGRQPLPRREPGVGYVGGPYEEDAAGARPPLPRRVPGPGGHPGQPGPASGGRRARSTGPSAVPDRRPGGTDARPARRRPAPDGGPPTRGEEVASARRRPAPDGGRPGDAPEVLRRRPAPDGGPPGGGTGSPRRRPAPDAGPPLPAGGPGVPPGPAPARPGWTGAHEVAGPPPPRGRGAAAAGYGAPPAPAPAGAGWTGAHEVAGPPPSRGRGAAAAGYGAPPAAGAASGPSSRVDDGLPPSPPPPASSLPEPPAELPGGWADGDPGRAQPGRRRRKRNDDSDGDGFWPERWRD
jgi:putative ABC transport system ATP-binding protein